MSSSDILFLVAIVGSYLAFVWILSVLDQSRVERRR